jgi:hypothetical protein
MLNYLNVSILKTCFTLKWHSSLTIFDNFFSNIKSEAYSHYSTSNSTTISYELLKYVFIPFLITTIFFLVLLLLIHRYNFEKKSILVNELNIKFDDFLTKLIFSNLSKKEIHKQIKEKKAEVLFKKKWHKGLILNKIISIKQNIHGIDPNLLLQIYKSFGFHQYSKNLILSRKWQDKLLGIYHYQILEYKIKTGYIRPYVNNHKNKYLNSNALIAMIILSDEKFELIANYKRKISKVDELKILDIIYKKNTLIPANINDWLYSENSSIVILAIKLMVRKREALTLEQISFLLNNDSLEVRKEVLLAISLLYIIEAEELLRDYYSTTENKKTIVFCLKTFAVIGDVSTKDFLCGFLKEESQIDLKFQLVKTINKIDRLYFDSHKSNSKAEKDIIDRILLHVNNPYLN